MASGPRCVPRRSRSRRKTSQQPAPSGAGNRSSNFVVRIHDRGLRYHLLRARVRLHYLLQPICTKVFETVLTFRHHVSHAFLAGEYSSTRTWVSTSQS